MKTQAKKGIDERGDFVDELAAAMPAERVERAKKEAEKEIFRIRLAELRKKMGVRQEDIKTFTQSGISKLEARKDMKVSTLIEYLDSIGMGIEIKAYPKRPTKKPFESITLIKA
jgi:hypothetical protein